MQTGLRRKESFGLLLRKADSLRTSPTRRHCGIAELRKVLGYRGPGSAPMHPPAGSRPRKALKQQKVARRIKVEIEACRKELHRQTLSGRIRNRQSNGSIAKDRMSGKPEFSFVYANRMEFLRTTAAWDALLRSTAQKLHFSVISIHRTEFLRSTRVSRK